MYRKGDEEQKNCLKFQFQFYILYLQHPEYEKFSLPAKKEENKIGKLSSKQSKIFNLF